MKDRQIKHMNKENIWFSSFCFVYAIKLPYERGDLYRVTNKVRIVWEMFLLINFVAGNS